MRHEDYALIYTNKKGLKYRGNSIKIFTENKDYTIYFDGIGEDADSLVLIEVEGSVERRHVAAHILDAIYVRRFFKSVEIKLIFILPSLYERTLRNMINNEIDLMSYFLKIDIPEIEVISYKQLGLLDI